jgi:suppressor of ftsI
MQMKTSVTKPQLIAVTVITLLLLATGISISGIFGDFSMGPNIHGVSKQGSFSTDIKGLTEATSPQVVNLKNGDTYDLIASIVKKNIAGNEVKMLAYNGSIPGPIIKVPKGAEITINFTNHTDVPTTVHSHGVRLDNKFDGVPDVTQKEIGVGQSFSYIIKFPDEGVYWYHPHIREDYAQELGLYGNYIVASDDPNYWSPVNEEIPLMVDDILIENGKVASFGPTADHALMGRFGNVMLANGSDNYSLSVKQGEVARFYVTNVANTRTFNLAIPGAKIKLVGADNGRYEKESFVDSVLISPSERVVVDVLFDKAGTYTIEHKTPDKTYTMGKINVASDAVATSYKSQFLTLRTNADIRKALPNLDSYFSKSDDKRLSLTVDTGSMNMSNGQMSHGSGHMMSDGTMMGGGGMTMGGNDTEKIEWEDSMAMMNQMADANVIKWKIVDQDTGKSGNDINWNFKVGDKVKIKIFNDPNSPHPMQHPVHFHGQKFLVLSTNGVKNENLVWKDTTLVQKGDSVEILVDMENPGTWMAHCHIAEHLESGMMFNFKVN